jgi:glycosyltransferase involved in cell wall biosynthesis
MRIGMMADVYKPHVSGVTHYVSLNKKVLERAGHEVFVFTFGAPDYEDDETNVIRSAGVTLATSGYSLGIRYRREARRLLQTMDVVHVHHPFLSGRLAIAYCRPWGIPIVFTHHTRYDLYAQVYFPILPEQLGYTFLQAYMPSFCRDLDLVIAPSPSLAALLAEMGVTAGVKVIPNGVDLAPFRAACPIDRATLGLRPDEIVLVYAGRLGIEKNLPFLLRAVAGIQGAHPRVRLLLVGDGPEKDNLEDQARHSGFGDRILFTGLVPYADIPGFLAVGDVFVTASRTEVHPLSVIEALASGLPVVGIDSPGVSDTVVDGDNGFIAADDLASYTAKLSRIVLDDDLRRRLAERARQSAEAYDIERTGPQVEACYRELVARKPRRRETRWQRVWQDLLDHTL